MLTLIFVITALDVNCIYEVPLFVYHKEGLDDKILQKLNCMGKGSKA